MFNPSSPVSGAAVTGFTSPTYTLTADTAPGNNGKQFAVTALGGTQANVTTHSVSDPFTHTMFKPQQARVVPPANPVTGVVKNIPNNVYKNITRKGARSLATGQYGLITITTIMSVPAGVEIVDSPELQAAISLHHGILWQQASGIADTAKTNIL